MNCEVKHNLDMGMGHLWLNRWDIYGLLRKRQGMVLVGETCEYHSRGEGYGVSLG